MAIQDDRLIEISAEHYIIPVFVEAVTGEDWHSCYDVRWPPLCQQLLTRGTFKPRIRATDTDAIVTQAEHLMDGELRAFPVGRYHNPRNTQSGPSFKIRYAQ
jgi:hypothetical protein